MKSEKRKLALIVISYLLVYIVWGSTYYFIKLAVETIPPLYVVGLRFLFGGLFFLFLAFILGRMKKLPTGREVLNSIFLGAFLLIGGNGLVTFAEKKVDSYLAALIISTTPVAVAVFDRLLIGKRITPLGMAGLLLGVSGVGFLLYNGQSIRTSLNPYMLVLIAALVSWAFATSLGHKLRVHRDTFVNSGIQMLFTGITCLFTMSFFKPGLIGLAPAFSGSSIFGVGYLAVVGSMAFCAYNYLIQNEPAIRIVTYAFVNPVIAIVIGLVFAGESRVPFLLPGILLILFALFFMFYGDGVYAFLKKKPGGEAVQGEDGLSVK